MFVAFYVIDQARKFGWMQGAELLVNNLLFGRR